jgi:hypothetical protein
MERIFPARRLLLILLIFAAFALPLKAQGFFGSLSWSVSGSVLIFPENNGLHSDPMPVLPSPGMGAAYPVMNPLWLEMTLDLYFTHYRYDFSLDRAVPAAIENRSAFVMGSALGFQGVYRFDITPAAALRVYGGPAADMRIVLIAEDLNEGVDRMDQIRRETDAVFDYFWGSGRWLLPVIGAGMDFSLNSKVGLGFDLRVWFPLYRLWTAEDLPAIEGWRFGIGARITFIRS